MGSVYIGWLIYGIVFAVFAFVLGYFTVNVNPNLDPNSKDKQSSILGIFVDTRHRVSLSRFQIILWTIIILSLIASVWTARAIGQVGRPLDFTIPGELLTLAGISLGSTVISSAIKSGKDQQGVNTNSAEMEADNAARDTNWNIIRGQEDKQYKPRFFQLFMHEEGGPKVVDKIVDPTKFQSFIITLVLAAAFVVSSLNEFTAIEIVIVPEQLRQEAIAEAEEAGEEAPTEEELEEIVPTQKDILNGIKELPGFDENNTFLLLLGLSHAGYLAGKLPPVKED